MRGKEQGGEDEKQIAAARAAALGDEKGGRGEDDEGGERQPPDADDRRRLHHHRRRRQDVAERIPGKAGEQVAAQPLGKGERHGEDENPRPAFGPEETGERRTESPEQGKPGRHGENGEGQRPGEFVGVDEEGRADPPKPGEEIAEAEAPADGGGGPKTAERARAFGRHGAVDQPDEDRRGEPQQGKGREGRQRQRRDGAGKEGDGEPPPAPKHDDRIGGGVHRRRSAVSRGWRIVGSELRIGNSE
jgi:hypothetical protein